MREFGSLARPTESGLARGVFWLVLTRGISALGSGMTMFAINVWVFEQSHSYATFAGLTLLTSLPNLLLAPIVGVIVDRCHKKLLLAACEASTVLAVLFVLAALLRGSLGLWQAGAAVLMLSIASNFRWTLMGATIGSLVPREQLGRVNGMRQAMSGVSEVCAPLLGAMLLHTVGPRVVFCADIATSLIAMLAVAMLDAAPLAPQAARGDIYRFWNDAMFGLRWVAGNPRMRRLLAFITGYNFAAAVFMVGFLPRLLGFSGEGTLGVAFALEAGGALLGGILFMRLAADIHRLESLIYLCAAGFGAVMTAWGATRNAYCAFALAFISGLLTSAIVAALQTTWQAQVPPPLQGRVFAARRMVSYSLIPVATLLSIPLSSHVMTPLIAATPVLQGLWGDALQGGIGLLTSLLGALLVPVSLALAHGDARACDEASRLDTEQGKHLK